jgi:hypothetical protein
VGGVHCREGPGQAGAVLYNHGECCLESPGARPALCATPRSRLRRQDRDTTQKPLVRGEGRQGESAASRGLGHLLLSRSFSFSP